MGTFSIPDDQANKIINDFIKTQDSYLVIAYNHCVNSKTAKAIGMNCLGKDMFYAREDQARKVLATKIQELLLKGVTACAVAEQLKITSATMWRINNQFGIDVNELKEQAKIEPATQGAQQSQEYTFIEITNEAQNDEQTSNDVHSPMDSSDNYAVKERSVNSTYPSTKSSKQEPAISSPYHQGYRPYYQDYRRNNNYRRPYQEHRDSTEGQTYRPRAYNDKSYIRQTIPNANVVRMRYQGMEFTFNCGDKNPEDVVLELMQKVQGGCFR